MKPQRLPEYEYLLIARKLQKLDAKVAKKMRCPVVLARIVKKATALINRAAELESIMQVPEERRFTNAYR